VIKSYMNPTSLANILNVGTTFSFEGKTYTIKEADFVQRAEFSEWVQEQSILFIKRKKEKGIIDDIEYQASLANLAKDQLAFEFEGEICLRALGQPAGASMFLYFMLRHEYPEIDEEMASRIYKAKIKEVHEAVERIKNDPKALKELADLIVGGKSSDSFKTNRKTRRASKSPNGKRQRK